MSMIISIIKSKSIKTVSYNDWEKKSDNRMNKGVDTWQITSLNKNRNAMEWAFP